MTQEEVHEVQADETVLIRDCATLYVSFALESFFTVIMGIIFSYLLLLITNKGRLQRPGRAMAKMVGRMVKNFVMEIYNEVKKWPQMPDTPLEKRFALCRKANQGICAFTVFVAILTLTRWAHFNNVNGFRYLGYCVTCPPKQAELVLLIAPTIPCYRFVIVTTTILTLLMLVFGYGASVIRGELYEGSLEDFLATGDWSVLQATQKMYWLIPSMVLLIWLSLIQIPLLILWYYIKGGAKAGLPHGYVTLCSLVSLTWLAFPAWWLVSFEGAGFLRDTKLNAVGFAALNVISKGSFTLHMLSMSAFHRQHKKRQEAISNGRRPSELDLDPISWFAEHHITDAHEKKHPVARDPSSGKLRRSETTIITMLRDYSDEPKEGDLPWSGLDASQRAYLLGNGISPGAYKEMTTEERQAVIDEYDALHEIVLNDKADESLKEMPALTPRSPARTLPPMKEELTGETSMTFTSGGEVPLVGQKVSTANGTSGRVMKVMMDEVQVSLSGGVSKNLRIESLTKLVVNITHVEGPEVAKWATTVASNRVCCGCAIEGKHSSSCRTTPCQIQGDRIKVNYHFDIFGYEAGDTLNFTVWSHDEGKLGTILAQASVEGRKVQDDGFEGLLRLSAGRALEAELGLMAFVSGLPEGSGSSGVWGQASI